MRLLISLAVAVLAAFALSACKSADRSASNSPASVNSSSPASAGTTPVATTHSDGVRRITTVELQDLLAKGQAAVIDVRNEPSYKAGHIPGAKLIPNTQILNHVKELPRDKTIVTYCS